MTEQVQLDSIVVTLVNSQKDCIDALKLNLKFIDERLTDVINRYNQLEKTHNELLESLKPKEKVEEVPEL